MDPIQSFFLSPNSRYSTSSFKNGHGGNKEILNKLDIWTSPHRCWLGYYHYWEPSFPTTAVSLTDSHILRRPDSHLAASWLFWTPSPKWIFPYWNQHLFQNWIWLLCLPCFARYTICCLTECLVIKLNKTIWLLRKPNLQWKS